MMLIPGILFLKMHEALLLLQSILIIPDIFAFEILVADVVVGDTVCGTRHGGTGRVLHCAGLGIRIGADFILRI